MPHAPHLGFEELSIRLRQRLPAGAGVHREVGWRPICSAPTAARRGSASEQQYAGGLLLRPVPRGVRAEVAEGAVRAEGGPDSSLWDQAAAAGASDTNPNLVLMNYALARFGVTDLFFVPEALLHPGHHRGAAAAGGDCAAGGVGRLQHPAGRGPRERQGVVRARRRGAGAGRGARAVALDPVPARRRRGGAGMANRGDEMRREAVGRADVHAAPTSTPSRAGSRRSIRATATCARRYASSCGRSATAAGSEFTRRGAGIGCGGCDRRLATCSDAGSRSRPTVALDTRCMPP